MSLFQPLPTMICRPFGKHRNRRELSPSCFPIAGKMLTNLIPVALFGSFWIKLAGTRPTPSAELIQQGDQMTWPFTRLARRWSTKQTSQNSRRPQPTYANIIQIIQIVLTVCLCVIGSSDSKQHKNCTRSARIRSELSSKTFLLLLETELYLYMRLLWLNAEDTGLKQLLIIQVPARNHFACQK